MKIPIDLEDFKKDWQPLIYFCNEPITVIVFDTPLGDLVQDFEVYKFDGTSYGEILFRGTLRWDGCSNLEIGEQESGYVHTCGPHSLVLLHMSLMEAHRMAADRIPDNDCENYGKDVDPIKFHYTIEKSESKS